MNLHIRIISFNDCSRQPLWSWIIGQQLIISNVTVAYEISKLDFNNNNDLIISKNVVIQ